MINQLGREQHSTSAEDHTRVDIFIQVILGKITLFQRINKNPAADADTAVAICILTIRSLPVGMIRYHN